MTLVEIAANRPVHTSTLARALRKGALAGRRAGGVWLTTLAAVDEWLTGAAHRRGPSPGSGTAPATKRKAARQQEQAK